jgi:hydroxymethylpyrimidine kinase/phosphomethylpyrimidine kinase/thiamine-phosphate diphosphorylase
MNRAADALRAHLQLYWVSDGCGSDPRAWMGRAEQALAAGVTCLQLRDKGASDQDLAERARAVLALCRRYAVPLVINDRVELARAVQADGVHLGQGDVDPVEARRQLPESVFIGWSIESLDQIDRARTLPVDYLAVSPVFETPTKRDTAPALGLAGLRAARRMTDQPLVAIGGIDAGNIASVIDAGADGVAVVRAIEGADEPAQAAGLLRGAFARAGRIPVPARVLTIAGSDSGGGAGIQADLKTFAALGCFGTSAITAVTAQNTLGVQGIHALPPEFLARQIASILDDIGADAIKIGMLHDRALVEVVAAALDRHPEIPVVLDPVMVATSGDALIREDTIEAIVTLLFPRATVVTPNLDELGLMVGRPLSDEASAVAAAQRLMGRGARAVLVKGGHLAGDWLTDILVDSTGERLRIGAQRIPSRNLHGTGCSLSSAIAARLAHGDCLDSAVRAATHYVREGLRSARWLRFGAGHGPLDHAHQPVRMVRYLAAARLSAG